MNRYPMGSIEFQHVPVWKDDVLVTTAVELADVPASTATDAIIENDWKTANLLEGKTGVMIAQTRGFRDVWARVTDNPEKPITFCGTYEVY
jgi:hypothetical protein